MFTPGSIGSRSEKPVSVIWGCELSSQRDSYTFQVPEDWHWEHQLALRTICLGELAPDEFHTVEVLSPTKGDACAPVPLATLRPSVLPMVTLMGLELTPPVTFRLRAGSGPLYISGQHVTMLANLLSDEEEEEDDADADDEEEDEEEEAAAEKSSKSQASKTSGAAEKRRVKEEQELAGTSCKAPLPRQGRSSGQGEKL